MTRLFWLAICGLILPPTAWLNAADDETRVHVRGSDGGPTVGRLIVQDAAAGKGFVYLPSGEIVIRDSSELYETDQLFKPLDHKALGEQLTASGPFQGFKVKQTRNYLYVYQSSDQFQNITARILESMFTPLKRYCDRAGIKTQDPEFPLVVIIFSDHRQMRTYRDLPPSIVAFYEPLSNRVILCEHSQLVEQAPEIGIPQAFSTIAHEGVHQILHNVGVQDRLSRWPAWLSEGLAEYFAPCELNARGTWKGVGQRNDLRMLELMQFPAPRPGRRTLTEQSVLAPQLTSAGYATSWALTHFLAQKRSRQFQEYLREVSEMGPLERSDPNEELARFKRIFGDDLDAIEQGLYRHVLSLQRR